MYVDHREGEKDLVIFGNHEEETEPIPENLKKTVKLKIPAGNYEIDALGAFIKKAASALKIDFQLTLDRFIMKVIMSCNYIVVFSKNRSIQKLFGFENEIYLPGHRHMSEKIPQITSINTMNIHCNIINGSFQNGRKSHTLYSFYPDVPTGYKLTERPNNILFLPVNVGEISN